MLEGSLELAVTPTILDFDSFAAGINNDGDVCGVQIGIPRSEDLPVVWKQATTESLSVSPKVVYPAPTAINQSGVIVGSGWFQDRKSQGLRAIVWTNFSSEAILLESFLARRSPLVHLQSAEAVNDAGAIVGKASGGAYIAVPN